ncbi:DNA cytosine methyltransferase [Crocosphaera sp.]|uniref:DNA cytosine methyltransferase n=1 Tax=Crocosphaera sp. TaxID=2729996 RepID=UPI003F1EE8AA|nr:DNA cytosine methyltransferase [Crocosphaera sp.]
MSSNYIEEINNILKPNPLNSHLVLDLFAGCGGLSLGFEAQGFETYGLEKDEDCCYTYEQNLQGNCEQIELTVKSKLPTTSVIIGGPPCQPFSVGGKQKGLTDSRDGFPIFINAIKQVKPDIWLFENVRGLLYKNKWYFEEITQVLQELNYIIEWKLLNSVDFGVPQNRQRLIVVGHRGKFQFPQISSKRITAGEALGELAFQVLPNSKFLTPSMDKYIAKYEKASCCKRPRDLHLDKPARTLTCRNLAGATGDMQRIKLPDGRRRRLSIREAARLQSFPDWFEFSGSETSCYNQIGNAVSPLLAFYLAKSVRDYLESSYRLSSEELKKYTLPQQLSLHL